jgi:hypothetical protein
MWSWFNCYLSGRHEYGMWCEPGSIFLRCIHCGRRSPGWALNAQQPAAAHHEPAPAKPQLHLVPRTSGRVVPFTRSVAS